MLKKDSVLVVDVEWLLVLDLDSLLLSESGQVCVCVWEEDLISVLGFD